MITREIRNYQPVRMMRPGRRFVRHASEALPQAGNGAGAKDPSRLLALSDGVFAVLITVLMLELRPPESPAAASLWSLWPSAVAYGVSYLFIAIVWVNHHHLLRFAEGATQRLIWLNFAHLFTVSLIPFSTAWIATTRLAPLPVCLYAAVFMFVNVTYVTLCDEAVDRHPNELSAETRHAMHIRSVATIGIFAASAAAALVLPILGLAMIVLTLVLYVRPEALAWARLNAAGPAQLVRRVFRRGDEK
jgi:uncharacterized membrane protein